MKGIVSISTELIRDTETMREVFALMPIVECLPFSKTGTVEYIFDCEAFDEDMAEYCPVLARDATGKLSIVNAGKVIK